MKVQYEYNMGQIAKIMEKRAITNGLPQGTTQKSIVSYWKDGYLYVEVEIDLELDAAKAE